MSNTKWHRKITDKKKKGGPGKYYQKKTSI